MFNKILKSYSFIVAFSSFALGADNDAKPFYELSEEKIHQSMPLLPPPPTHGRASGSQTVEEKEGRILNNKISQRSPKKRPIKDIFPEAAFSTPPLKTPVKPIKKVSDSKVGRLIKFLLNLRNLKSNNY